MPCKDAEDTLRLGDRWSVHGNESCLFIHQGFFYQAVTSQEEASNIRLLSTFSEKYIRRKYLTGVR